MARTKKEKKSQQSPPKGGEGSHLTEPKTNESSSDEVEIVDDDSSIPEIYVQGQRGAISMFDHWFNNNDLNVFNIEKIITKKHANKMNTKCSPTFKVCICGLTSRHNSRHNSKHIIRGSTRDYIWCTRKQRSGFGS